MPRWPLRTLASIPGPVVASRPATETLAWAAAPVVDRAVSRAASRRGERRIGRFRVQCDREVLGYLSERFTRIVSAPTPEMSSMHKTPLDVRHRSLGARMVPFAGWEMPVQYSSIVAEHKAVRENAALFDLSHMGELWIRGPQAAAFLDYALVTAPSRLAVGRAHYSMITDADGGVIDDLIVYRTATDEFLVVANASNREAVAAELQQRKAGYDVAPDEIGRASCRERDDGRRA